MHTAASGQPSPPKAAPALVAAPPAPTNTPWWYAVMGRSLFWRIYLWFLLAAVVIAVTVAITVYFTDPDLLYTRRRYIPIQLRDQQAARGAEIFEKEGKKTLRRYLDDLARAAGQAHNDARPFDKAYLFDQEGHEVSGVRRTPESAEALALRAVGNTDEHIEVRLNRMLTARATTGPSGKPYVFVSVVPRKSLLVPADISGWLRVGVVLAAAAAVCWWLARYVSAPVRLLRTATRQLAAGNLSVRVHPSLAQRADEFSDLASDFDDMASRIGELLAAQRRLIADVSHELGSPLTRVNVALGLAFRKAGPGASVELERIGRETKRLSGLIHQLLLLSQLESRAGLDPTEDVNLRELIDDVAADASFEAANSGRTVRVAADGVHGRLRGARHLLRSAVENVVRNAVRFTAPGTEVLIELEQVALTGIVQPSAANGHGLPVLAASGGLEMDNGQMPVALMAVSATAAANNHAPTATIVRVRDHGPGVPPEALDKLFRPFYRVSEAREHHSGGAGLGLAIAEQAVKAHGGTLRASNVPEGGLCVEIELKTVG